MTMDYLLWVCSLVVPVVLAVEETLMDSRWATTELAWTTFPESGWEEVSGYDDSMSPIRTYQVCNVRQPNQNNWLRTDFIPRKGVLRVYVELKFSVRDCASIPNIPGSCKETFNLFYYESEGDTATDTSPLWRENPYVKVDTIAPDESFSLLEAGRINTKVRSFGPLSKAGFYLAFQDLGACMSLISVRVFFKKCSTTIANFAVFPETATGAEATSLVIAPGACVTNAMEVSVPLKLYCNGDGEWMVPVGSCTCVAGFEPSADSTQCQACAPGNFKSKFGEGSCAPCPSNSRTSARGTNICSCQNGFYRADSDPPDSACTTIPSAPRNVISSVNETSLSLEWEEPEDTGGRSDLVYNVVCKKCLRDRSPCTRCDDNVDIAPRRLGLRQRKVVVRNLQAHTRYSFEVQAVNGVSGKNPTSPSYSTVNITTNQAAPSAVPTVHLMRSTSDTLSLSWLPPEKPNGVILDYEIKYHERGQAMSHTVTAQHSSAKVEGLRAATPYVVQVRARTVAGYGRYSNPMDFSTSLHSDPQKSVQDQLPLIIGSASAGLVVIVALVVIAVVCLKKQRSGSELEYTEKLQQYISPGVKVYIDPFTYEDPNDAVHEFAKEIDISCVKIEEVIGAGEFGEVCRGRLKQPGRREMVVAIKTLKAGYTERQRRDFLGEASIMGQFDHPNVIRLEGVLTRSCPVLIITEFMENGALDSFLRLNDGRFTMTQLVGMLRGIAAGMKYLSDMNYVHRDLAARNILVNSNLVCKVSDFGLSRFLDDTSADPTYTSSLGGKIPIRWTAPEAIAFRKFTSASDVWSYGIVMWEVVSYGERPYWDMSNQDVMTAVEQDYRLPPPMDCPMVLHQLMLECWMKERNLRPKFSRIVSTLDKLLRNAASLKVVTSTNSGDLLRLGGTLPGHNRKSPDSSQEIVRQQMSQTLPIRV
ncbi:ephrin type-B receptor 3-like [Seriola lalandi dorsalis]|uniref:Ephrin type-B receptor 3 n=1 Tax=Seriola lalandi dorsalis TaxID=1841481 RepID=A0A3B4XTY1_SERLL|nr:ephrin type-B receptor 3-like [Seriola lalandi dorsalis]XP_056248337.1 ephrin type-B receptor 3 [Seriola aureovittata]